MDSQPQRPREGGTQTILIAEDDDAVRPMVERILKRLGYAVLAARHGAEALAVLAEHREKVHLLVTDISMPEISGPDLARRAAEAGHALKVLYMSALSGNRLIEGRALDSGAAFLKKPFTPEDLAKKVREVLDAP
jgi:CheY-like chemotaxis protein